MIEGKKTAGRPRNSYLRQIKCDARIKTFKELKEKASNWSKWRTGVVTNLRVEKNYININTV